MSPPFNLTLKCRNPQQPVLKTIVGLFVCLLACFSFESTSLLLVIRLELKSRLRRHQRMC